MNGKEKNLPKNSLKNLSQDQKNFRRKRCLDFLVSIENHLHFLELVITGYVFWMFEYHLETKCAWNSTLQSYQVSKIDNQMHADLLFQWPRNCSQRVCASSRTVVGCCITTMCLVTQQFKKKVLLPVKIFLWFLSLLDLCPCDIFLFLRLRNYLKEHHFRKLKTNQLKVIPVSEYQYCYED